MNKEGKVRRINPFHPRTPATPELFVGRSYEIDKFCESTYSSAKLNSPSPEHIAILGNWGMGKTSLLMEFRYIVENELKDEIKCFSLYCTISSKDGRNWESFTSHLLREVKKAALMDQRITEKLKEKLKEWNFGLSVGPIKLEKIKKEGAPDLEDSLEELWNSHLKPSGFEICIIYLDDIHNFQFTDEDDLYVDLRNVFQDLIGRGCNYLLAIATLPEPFYRIAEFAEQFTRYFSHIRPKPFTLDETRSAIVRRLKSTDQEIQVEEELVKRIHVMAAGHPFVTMLLMSELFKKSSGEVMTLEELELNMQSIMEDIWNSMFQGWYDIASEKERSILLLSSKMGLTVMSAGNFKSIKNVSNTFESMVKKELLINVNAN